MYCNHCGAPLGQDQLACPTCGRSVADVRSSIAIRTRVAANLHLMAIFWFVMAGFWMIPTAVMVALGAAAEKPELLPRSILFVALAEGLAVLGFAIAMMLLQKI